MSALVRPLLLPHIPIPDIVNRLILPFIPFDEKFPCVIITIKRETDEEKRFRSQQYYYSNNNVNNYAVTFAREHWMEQNNYPFHSRTENQKYNGDATHCVFYNVPYFGVISLKLWSESNWGGRRSERRSTLTFDKEGIERHDWLPLDSPEFDILYRPRSFVVLAHYDYGIHDNCSGGYEKYSYFYRESIRNSLMREFSGEALDREIEGREMKIDNIQHLIFQ